MPTINADDVRIPRIAREALARHEEVVVLNRDRPVYVIISPEDRDRREVPTRRGRPLREALAILAAGARPDPAFVQDMVAVRRSVGPMPADPWQPS